MMEEDCFDPETSSVVDTNSWAILQLMQGGQAEAISHFVSLSIRYLVRGITKIL